MQQAHLALVASLASVAPLVFLDLADVLVLVEQTEQQVHLASVALVEQTGQQAHPASVVSAE